MHHDIANKYNNCYQLFSGARSIMIIRYITSKQEWAVPQVSFPAVISNGESSEWISCQVLSSRFQVFNDYL